MKTTKLTILSLAIVAGVLSSCKKKTTEGPAGKDGNANVHSFTFSTTSSAWTLNNKTYNATFTLESIDASILSSGTVNVFLGDGTGSRWTAMPVTQQGIQYNYSISIHTVGVGMSSASDANPPLSNPGVQQFRVIVISGSARMAHPNVNLNNYNEMKRTFNLKD